MNYERIYRAFIADRRTKGPGAEEYAERHHILPRCMGGGDEPENLIRLTPEDHFFAHLLLAKMHGGKMISALWRMLQSTDLQWGRRTGARRSYGLATGIVARFLRENWTADGNPLFNTTIFRWWNYRTGSAEDATIYAMCAKYGGSRPSWTMVASGERPSVRGWLLESRRFEHRRSEKGQSFNFVHRDGRLFTGTQGEFSVAFGISLASSCRIVRHAAVTECGWRLEGTQDRRGNGPKSGARSSRTGTGRTYHLKHRDGRTFTGNCDEFRRFLGKPEGFNMSVRLGTLRRGAAPTLYGWSINNDASGRKYPVD
jgi:hypothetical protein